MDNSAWVGLYVGGGGKSGMKLGGISSTESRLLGGGSRGDQSCGDSPSWAGLLRLSLSSFDHGAPLIAGLVRGGL